MDAGLRTSATGMKAQQLMVETIANNLANVNTTGFKKSRVAFEDLLYENLQGAAVTGGVDRQVLAPVQIGKGVRLAAIARVHGQGAVQQTGRPQDMAIEGEGFFQVQRPDGSIAYTRDGSFSFSDTGALVTNGGYRLLPGVVIPPDATNFGVSPSGIVTVSTAGSSAPIEIGRVELARFVNPSGLQTIGENLLIETAASGRPVTGFPQDQNFGRLLQGTLESSNVEIVTEMTDMIAAQRAYEINAKAIRAAEEMSQVANDLVR